MVGRPRKQPIDGMWKCAKCEEYKPESEFYRAQNNINGLMNRCKACVNLYQSERKTRIAHELRRQTLQRMYPDATQPEIAQLVEWSLLKEAAEKVQDYGAYVTMLRREQAYRIRYSAYELAKDSDEADSKGRPELESRFTPEQWAEFQARARNKADS